MMFITLFLSLIAPASAGPAGHEAQFETSLMNPSGSSWDLITSDAIRTVGVRGGFQLAPNINITAGWRHGSSGSRISFGDAGYEEQAYEEDEVYYEDEYYDEVDGPYVGIVVDQYSVGAKYSWAYKHWIQPYASGEANLTVGHILLDDDPYEDGSTNEIRRGALAPGGSTSLGVEFLPLSKEARVRVSLWVETGYQANLPLNFTDSSQKNDIPMGSLSLNGMVTRFGVGARF